MLAILFAVVYVSALVIEPLRRADDQAKQFGAAHNLNDRIRSYGLPQLNHMMTGLVIVTVLVLAAVIVALAQRRGHMDAELARAAAIPVVAFAVAEGAKILLPRPAASFEPWWLAQASYPSGHAATGVAALLALFALSRRPLYLVPLLAPGIAVFGIGVVLSGQHRPSDALGALLIALLAFWAVGPLHTERIAADAAHAQARPHATDPHATDAGIDVLDVAAITAIMGVVAAAVAAMSAPPVILLHAQNADGSFALLAVSLAMIAVVIAVAASDMDARAARTRMPPE